MFYSHTFLARKSPLGTVWIAAHLQHKLRKSHVTVTDIASSVDCIMFPEVPIALRLSGHLLLGVVRIYSKKVDYLFNDCNEVLTRIRTAFASLKEVNLSEDASRAPFHSITLPETFELDSLDLGEDLYFGGSNLDNLPEWRDVGNDIVEQQTPFEKTINEKENLSTILEDIPISQKNSNLLPEVEISAEATQKLSEDDSLPGIEVMRHTVHSSNLENRPEWHDNINEQQMPFEKIINEKDNLSPIFEDIPVSGGQSAEYQLDPPTTIAAEESLGVFGSHASLGGLKFLIMAIQPTPPAEKKNAKSRKRKQYFDESVVLTNEFIKEGLKDASKLVRKQKKLPCSALDFWKFNIRSKKDHVFLERSNSGLCTNIGNIFNNEFISSKVNKIPEEPEVVQSSAPMLDPDMEIEQLRFEEPQVDNYLSPTFMPSPSGRDELPHIPPSNLGSEPQTEVPHTLETEVLPTFEQTTSAEQVDVDMETPMTHLEEQVGLEHTGFSDIPELQKSTEAEDLTFLEADNTPAGKLFKLDYTAAVAQYFKKQSPTTGTSNEHSEKLSLNRILEGKTRKHCARMFYETLVLTSYGLIDVQQDEAYGDVTLLLTSTLTKATF
ncbi:Rad21/Rec8-like protein [Macleaya cordata]|uniref:Rad21/Rec8-like protein n=1 Tax=Macleaya cordata TaxID=56857 RepID=A0A200QL69_MACCD|nr:Rad21/Rec8-like protein [Macleaya cordata]